MIVFISSTSDRSIFETHTKAQQLKRRSLNFENQNPSTLSTELPPIYIYYFCPKTLYLKAFRLCLFCVHTWTQKRYVDTILAIAVLLKYIGSVFSNPLQTSFRDIVPSNG